MATPRSSNEESRSHQPVAQAGNIAALDDESALALWAADLTRQHFRTRRIERDLQAVRRCLTDLGLPYRRLTPERAAPWCKACLAEAAGRRPELSQPAQAARAVQRFCLFIHHPVDAALLTALLEDWWARLVGGKRRNVATAANWRDRVLRFIDQRGHLWRNTRRDMDRYSLGRVEAGVARETLRADQGCVKRCIDFAREDGFDEQIYAQTGCVLQQICTPENTIKHLFATAEGEISRPMTDGELSRFFACLRAREERALRNGCKGLWSARRDFALFQTMLGTGGRDSCLASAKNTEEGLTRAYTREIARFSYYEEIRFWGKAEPGGNPKERTVYAVDWFRHQWAALRRYVVQVRPHFACAKETDALFLGERGPLTANEISSIFRSIADEARLPKDLHAHCLRHTFAQHLAELGVDIEIIRDLLGHNSSATTKRYVKPRAYMRRRLLECGRRQRAESRVDAGAA